MINWIGSNVSHTWKEIKQCLSSYRWTKLGTDAYVSVLLLRPIPLVCQLPEISHGDSHTPNISPSTCFERQTYNKCMIFNWTLPTAVKIQQTKQYLIPQFSKDTQKTPHLSLVIMILKKLKFLFKGCHLPLPWVSPLLPRYRAHISLSYFSAKWQVSKDPL